jgi:general secretion pathway protein M
MNALMQWYEELPERDQKIVHIAVPIVAVVLVIFAVILPIHNAVNELQEQVIDHKKAIVLLHSLAPQSQSTSGKKSFSSLTNVVTNTTREFGFRLDRFEEKKTGEINVWFDSIAFDKMLMWLAKLENEYGITASNISVSQTNEVGIVRANIRLIAG